MQLFWYLLLLFIYMWKVWLLNHSVSLSISVFSVFFVFKKIVLYLSDFSVFEITCKWNLSCNAVDSPYVCIRVLISYLLSQTEGEFTREENNWYQSLEMSQLEVFHLEWCNLIDKWCFYKKSKKAHQSCNQEGFC